MIDRETVIKELENYEPYARAFSNITVTGSIVLDAIILLKEQSEIVLCKDCKYGEHMCKPWSDIICNQNRATHIPDWFCADGKRKEI